MHNDLLLWWMLRLKIHQRVLLRVLFDYGHDLIIHLVWLLLLVEVAAGRGHDAREIALSSVRLTA